MLALIWYICFHIIHDSIQITRTKVSCHVCAQLMVPYNYTEFIDGLTYLVKNRFIPMSRVDDAVKRILRVKFTMGLFEKPLADYSMAKYLGSQEHRDLAREAVRKTLALLKNGKSLKKPLLLLPKKSVVKQTVII
ncbi:putative glucan 1,3-beta-glucosidase [Helianthus debilis subsp. tardiflorus]